MSDEPRTWSDSKSPREIVEDMRILLPMAGDPPPNGLELMAELWPPLLTEAESRQLAETVNSVAHAFVESVDAIGDVMTTLRAAARRLRKQRFRRRRRAARTRRGWS